MTAPQSTPGAGEASPDQVAAARDAAFWAKAVTHLKVSDVPAEAINRNVEGRRLVGPVQGFGKMWQKTFQVRIPADRVSPTELVATWKARFPEFWPRGPALLRPADRARPGRGRRHQHERPGA